MSKIYISIITILIVASLAFATDQYQFSWSSQQAANEGGTKLQAASYGLPDSVLQIKNVRANVDLDKDGKMEFMVPVMWEDAAGVPLRSIILYENAGNDRYDKVWSYTFPDSADQFVTVDVSDLDGDGMLEILAVNVRKEGQNDAGPNLYVFENVGDNDYGTEPTVTWDLGNSDRDVVRVAKAADLDGDGKQEVVMTAFLTQPAIVIASVSDFSVPIWTTEYINNEIGGVAPDIAAIGIGDMDNDGIPEVVLTEGASNKLLVIEATGANAYAINEVDMPVAGKTVSVHSIEIGDVNDDNRDEAYIANLQGTVWVVSTAGDAQLITTANIHAVADTEEQWLEAGLGDLGLGGVDFVIAGSNGSNAVDFRYVGGASGDVTDPTNYITETLIDSQAIDPLVPGGVRVYGLDFGDDMDGDGLKEIVFTRGSTRGGKDSQAIFILEVSPTEVIALTDSVLQIKNVRANVDLDKDGKKEFMVPVMWEDAAGVPLRSILVYENSANDQYDQVWSYTFPDSADQFVTVDVSDLDGDGMLEILAVNVRKEGQNDAGPNLYVFENVGDNDYGTEPTVTWDLGNSDRDVVRVAKAADLDGDGKQEVVMTAFLTQPAIVIASVSDFSVPIWTTEYINNEIGGVAPDIAAIGIGDMDNDGIPEVVLTEGASNKLLVIEATGANAYAINEVDMPVAGKTVSVHSIEMGDVDGNGKDEAFIANLQGTVWVVTATGDASAITTNDIHSIADTEEQWLEAGLGNLGLGGQDFAIAASNASKVVDYRYTGGDVTSSASYKVETLIDSAGIEQFVPGGIRVYGLDFGGDMDNDGLKEIVFTRGSTRGGKISPSIFVIEMIPLKVPIESDNLVAITALPDSVLQIKNVRANVDLDKDGKMEFMVPVMWENVEGIPLRSIYLYENSGNDAYDMVWSYTFPDSADQFVTVDVSDLDGDGMLEILAVNVRKEGQNDAGPNLYVFENVGDNDYGTEPTVTWDLGNSDRDVVRVAKAADLDGDGKQEVVMTAFLTQPAIVIASVSDFSVPIWTTEYINNEIGGVAPDIAAIGIGDMDNDGTPEVVLTEGASNKLLVIEATGANAYAINEVDMPVAGKTVSVHSIEMGDVNKDGKDEAFIANLQGTVWVVTANGDAAAITTSDIHAIADTEEQWLEAGLGDLALGGISFVIAGSNGSNAVDFRYTGGSVTNPSNYVQETLVDSAMLDAFVPGGLRVYGLDFGDDMDGDGLQEIIFTRGSTRGGKDSPSMFILEVTPRFPSGIAGESGLPVKFSLDQNYPNPFNPSTTIVYAISKPSQVELNIYDVLGRKVITLVNEIQTSNSYKIVWNGTDNNGRIVASGVYFYSLKTDVGTFVKRMNYIR